MEPRIQYCKTSDGVNIAYASIGAGPALLATSPLMFSDIATEFRTPEIASWYEGLAKERRLIRFDWRGMGMSDRDVSDFTIEAFLLDLEAVIAAARVEQVDLLGFSGPGQEMVAYAARHPERVRRLVLWSTTVHNRDILGERLNAVLSLAEKDWGLFCQTFAHNMLGWSRGGLAHDFAQALQAAIGQTEFVKLMAELVQHDVSPILEEVGAPTLVLHQPDSPVSIEHARIIASRIPNSQLVQLNPEALVPFQSPRGTHTALEFLADGEEPEDRGPDLPSGMTAILFADIVDSTALTEHLGDAAFRDKARELDGALRAIIREHSGTPIEGKLLGDGVLAVFTSARQAIEAALACGRAGNDAGLPLHLGLHAGDVIRESDPDGRSNVYGGAVNIASRISGLSAPGEVLVSETVRSLARTSAGVRFEDRGERALKGVGEAVRVWAVVEGEA